MEIFKGDFSGDLADVWPRYVAHTWRGLEGADGEEPVRERFGVRLVFGPSADLDRLHPAMDPVRDARYLRKLLTMEIDPSLGGSYGLRLRGYYRDSDGRLIDQIEFMVDRLCEKPESKAAAANLLHPPASDLETGNGMRRMACLTSLQALLRGDELHLVATFRSQDAVGSHGNFRALRELQREMLGRLEARGRHVRMGQLCVNVTAAHVYGRDFSLAEGIEKEVQ
jgi:thymidylate synthase